MFSFMQNLDCCVYIQLCVYTHTHEESRREIIRRNGAKERRGEQERVMGEYKQSRHYTCKNVIWHLLFSVFNKNMKGV